ncbi:MAG TPA: response regulator [Pseudolabrys sp.]|jgi:CheY-like chemotaxis protein|nr:response regulator [Pseudolabrys sp.]
MSGGDLVSLRMLVVAAALPEVDLWQRGAAMVTVPIEFTAADGTAAAVAILERGGVDICIVDHGLPAADKAAVTKAARSVKPGPLLVMSAPPGTARVEGADGALIKPADAADARKMVEVCIRAKMPTRVLIVDDSGTMRSIVRKILSGSRFSLNVGEAAEGIAALDLLRGGKFDLVFLDYNMPGLNGFETLSEIKRESPQVAVVIMTSTLDNAVAERAKSSGALAFLKKPFYPTDVDAVLERHFGLHMQD